MDLSTLLPDWAVIPLFLVFWFSLQRWILPRMGIPT